jgi:hypothetical protein
MEGIKIPREDALAILKADVVSEETREKILAATARFGEGDEVRWHESTRHPHNRATILEGPLYIGFPEVQGEGIGYLCEFPGPEGVGREEHPVLESDLLPYDAPEPA